MTKTSESHPAPDAPTREIAAWIASRPRIDEAAMTWARHCLLDWLGVTLAGAREDLVEILVAEAQEVFDLLVDVGPRGVAPPDGVLDLLGGQPAGRTGHLQVEARGGNRS